jgi:hypothetical protein
MDVDEDEGESEVNAMRSNALKAADEALKRKTSKKGEAGTEGFVGLNQANDNKVKKKFGRRQSRSSTDSSEAFDEVPVESVDPPAPPVQNTAKGLKRRKSGSGASSGGEAVEDDKENVDPAPAAKRASREHPGASSSHACPIDSNALSAAESAVGAPTEGTATHTSHPATGPSSSSAAASAEDASAEAQDSAQLQPVPPRLVRPSYLRLKTKNSDPAQCLDMIDDMYDIYFAKEDRYAAKPYMDRQDDINRKMRAILVDWMLDVHSIFKLETTTLWLSVNILDRYLMNVKVGRARLQLVGISSVLIACKYEEKTPPEVDDCIKITDEAYLREELLEMEKEILIALNYDIMVPTGYTFLTRYLNAIDASELTRNLASYYAERNLQEIDSLHQAPHLMAAAAIYAANVQQSQSLTYFPCRLENWGEILELESGLTEEDLVAYARIMVKHVGEETETASKRRLIACKKKFSSEENHGAVSKLRLPRILSN